MNMPYPLYNPEPHPKFPKWLYILLALLVFVWLMFCLVRNVRAMDIKLSKHFQQSEFSCKHCGETKVNMELVITLEKLRSKVNHPIIITSGYRCPLHNKQVGGAKMSQHLFGNAVDIKIKGYSPTQVARLAKECGFTWTKAYKTFTHVDIRQVKLVKQ